MAVIANEYLYTSQVLRYYPSKWKVSAKLRFFQFTLENLAVSEYKSNTLSIQYSIYFYLCNQRSLDWIRQWKSPKKLWKL